MIGGRHYFRLFYYLLDTFLLYTIGMISVFSTMVYKKWIAPFWKLGFWKINIGLRNSEKIDFYELKDEYFHKNKYLGIFHQYVLETLYATQPLLLPWSNLQKIVFLSRAQMK